MHDFWFGAVRPNCPSSATNNCVDKAQLRLCSDFAPLPKLCGQKSNLPCVARKAAMICFQKFNSRSTLGSRGYFFLIDISRRSCVNEAQSAEEKKITSGHRSTQSHFHASISSEIELGHRLDTPMSVVRCSQSGPLLYC